MRKIVNIIANRGNDISTQIDLSSIEIVKLWTIYDKQQLWNSYPKFNTQTGEKLEYKEITLDQLELHHHQGVFLEERLHDWNIRDNKLDFYSRCVKQGEPVSILIEYEMIVPDVEIKMEKIKKEILSKSKGVFINQGLIRIEGESKENKEWIIFHIKSEEFSNEEEFINEIGTTVDKIQGSIAWKPII